MNIASHVAAHHGPVAYFSLEMSPTEIAYRWLGSEARVDSMKLRSGLGGQQRLVEGLVVAGGSHLQAVQGSPPRR